MKRIWLVGVLIAFSAVAKFGYDYFYFDTKSVPSVTKNEPTKILVLPPAKPDPLKFELTPEAVQHDFDIQKFQCFSVLDSDTFGNLCPFRRVLLSLQLHQGLSVL